MNPTGDSQADGRNETVTDAQDGLPYDLRGDVTFSSQ